MARDADVKIRFTAVSIYDKFREAMLSYVLDTPPVRRAWAVADERVLGQPPIPLVYGTTKVGANVVAFAAEERGLTPQQISDDYVMCGPDVYMSRFSPSNVMSKQGWGKVPDLVDWANMSGLVSGGLVKVPPQYARGGHVYWTGENSPRWKNDSAPPLTLKSFSEMVKAMRDEKVHGAAPAPNDWVGFIAGSPLSKQEIIEAMAQALR